jgi:hypothetical protein
MKAKHLLLLFTFSVMYSFGFAQCTEEGKEQCKKTVTCSQPKSPDISAALAQWKGSYTRNGVTYAVLLDISRKDGEVVSLLSIPELGIKNKAYKAALCCGKDLHLKPAEGNAPVSIVVSQIGSGSLKGKIYLEEQSGSSQYSLAMNTSRN